MAEITRYCLALDLIDDEDRIAEYEAIHRKIWPEIEASIRAADIRVMDIYRVGNRLFMIMEVGPEFSFERKAAMDEANETVQKWEKLMWTFQQALPMAAPGEKWVMMKQIFGLPPR